MAIYDTAGSQYSAVTGRKRRFPYSAFIESQIPSLYQSRARQENKEFAEAQLSLEEQALEESARASNAALQESIRTSDIQAGLKREELSEQEKQAQTGALISGAQTAATGYYGASKLGLFGGKTAASAAPQAVTAGVPAGGTGVGKAIIDTSGAVTGYTGGGTVAPGGVGSLGIAGGIAAAAAVDDILSRRVAGTEKDPEAAFRQKTRGITRYGGSSPFTTALIEKGIGRGNLDKITDPTGILGKIEAPIAKYGAATIPKILGGSGGGTGSETLDTILNPIGTWLCTKTKEVVGMTDEEWSIIAAFRKYAREHYDNGLEWYISIGPKLIESINGNTEFYGELKKNFLEPVIGLTRGGYPEIAFSVYKAVVIALAEKWNPSLLESLPEEYRGNTNTRSS